VARRSQASARGRSRAGDEGEGAGSVEADDPRDARIRELEAELERARKTVSALIEKNERSTQEASPTAMFEAAARLEQIVARRTREVEEKSADLEAANAELRALTSNLDKIVRQRTRALAESEAQLREKNDELRRLNESKAEFISIAAHELRTPMTSIVGYLDLFMEGKFGSLDAKAQKPIRSLRRNAERLKRLIDAMLDVSLIEGNHVTLHHKSCSLEDIVNDVVEELAPLAEERKIEVVVTIDDPPRIDVDLDRIHQVVTNLLANAIRYNREGGRIDLVADREPDEKKYAGRWGRLRVRDTGIGIPEGSRTSIFEPFSEVGSARHHTSTGPDSAGLGLYIARGLIELHGGVIQVDSKEGEFTEFTVLLPVATV